MNSKHDSMSTSIRIRIYNEQNQWVNTLILKASKEAYNRYVQLTYEKH